MEHFQTFPSTRCVFLALRLNASAQRIETRLDFSVVNLYLLTNYEFEMKLLAFLSIYVFVYVG